MSAGVVLQISVSSDDNGDKHNDQLIKMHKDCFSINCRLSDAFMWWVLKDRRHAIVNLITLFRCVFSFFFFGLVLDNETLNDDTEALDIPVTSEPLPILGANELQKKNCDMLFIS